MRFATSVVTGVLLALAATAALADTQATTARRTTRLDLLAGHQSGNPTAPATPRGSHGMIDPDLAVRDTVLIPADLLPTRPSARPRIALDSVAAQPEMKNVGIRPTSLIADRVMLDLSDETLAAKRAIRPRLAIDSLSGQP